MAIYHLSVKPVARSKGRSATASAAYRAADKIKDERTREIHDYTKKTGVEYTEIITPTGEQIGRAALWNLAEQAEKRKDGTPAREYEIALPDELTPEQRKDLTLEFAQYLVKEQGCAVDIAIHKPGRSGDKRNHHAHLLCTTRRFENGGLWQKCNVELSGRDRAKRGLLTSKAELEQIRKKWAELSNRALQKAGHGERISHQSLKEQGFERESTIHVGVSAMAMERRGIQTERGGRNDKIIKNNAMRNELEKTEYLQNGLISAHKTYLDEKLARQAEARKQQAREQAEQAKIRVLEELRLKEEKERQEKELALKRESNKNMGISR